MSDDPTLRKPPSKRGYRVMKWIGGLYLLIALPLLLIFGTGTVQLLAIFGAPAFAVVWAVGFVGHVNARTSRQNLMSIYAMTKGGA